jgi:hypothetical protein
MEPDPVNAKRKALIAVVSNRDHLACGESGKRTGARVHGKEGKIDYKVVVAFPSDSSLINLGLSAEFRLPE